MEKRNVSSPFFAENGDLKNYFDKTTEKKIA